jgi:DNA repair protein RadC
MATYPTPPNRLRELALGERPQERLQRLGAGALADKELLAMLLRSGTRGQDVVTLAEKLLQEAGSLAGLLRWGEADFRRLKGIGRVKALQLLTVIEVARRILNQQQETDPLLDAPEKVFRYCRSFALGLAVEKCWALCLNRRNRLMRRVEITSGTAGSTLVHPREFFREAIRESASAVICVHNHPSGDPAPSAADLRMTRTLRAAAETLDIILSDHVIVGEPAHDPLGLGYYSFSHAGML